MPDICTAFLSLPLPHDQHTLDEDLPRLQEAFQILDAQAKQTAQTIQNDRDGQSSVNQELQQALAGVSRKGQEDAQSLGQALDAEAQGRQAADQELQEALTAMRQECQGDGQAVRDALVAETAARKAAMNLAAPIGLLVMWPAVAPPAGWLACDGSNLSASLYPKLFAVLGYTYGGSSGMFRLPDLRNQFIRGATASRTPGSTQGDAGRNLTGSCLPGALPGTFGPIAVNSFSGVLSQVGAGTGLSVTGANTGQNNYGIALNAALQWPTDTEFRPANVAMNFIIRVDD